MPTAITTLGAIVARFDGSDAAQDVAASGGLWGMEVPENKPLPFVVFLHEGDTAEWTNENAYTEECSFRFEVFANTLVAVEATATKIKTAFDLPGTTEAKAAFSITNGQALSCQRQLYVANLIGELDPSGELVFQAVIKYKLWVQKSL